MRCCRGATAHCSTHAGLVRGAAKTLELMTLLQAARCALMQMVPGPAATGAGAEHSLCHAADDVLPFISSNCRLFLLRCRRCLAAGRVLRPCTPFGTTWRTHRTGSCAAATAAMVGLQGAGSCLIPQQHPWTLPGGSQVSCRTAAAGLDRCLSVCMTAGWQTCRAPSHG